MYIEETISNRSLLEQLIDALQCFPGVGPKSAQRMALYLLQRNKDQGFALVDILQQALTEIKHCERCRALSEHALCRLCKDINRDQHTLCIVHTHYDMLAMEATGKFFGLYFVLHGALSPIDGIDGAALAIDKLTNRVKQESIEEVILATNASPEGEMTAYYIQQNIETHVSVLSKLAQGIPSASEVEYLDANTLALAIQGRKHISA